MQSSLSDFELANGELIVSGRLVDASNATLLCNLVATSDNLETSIRKVVYKPIAGERPLWDFPEGNLANREVAAYKISEFSGLCIVPLTVLRDGPYGMGAVQEWIEVEESVDLIALAQSHDLSIRKMALFDYLINNTDRKFGHILVTPSGRVLGCDHGVSFHRDFKLRTVIWQFAGSPLQDEEFEVLLFLHNNLSSVEHLLSPHLSKEEIEAFISRLENLRNTGHFPYPSPDWPAIPWPPV